MAAVSSTRSNSYPAAIAITAVVGLTASLVIACIGSHAEGHKLHSTWAWRLLCNQGDDFAWEGLVTFGGLAIVLAILAISRGSFIPKEINGLSWILSALATLTLGYGYEICQYCARHSHGDWRDLVAETLGWACTMVPILLAGRRYKARSRGVHARQ